ncbi:MAG: cysteine--tRNA ligase [Spirochaetota bacterium]
MSLKLHNTLGRTTEDFEPLDPSSVRLYSCGPTVYNYAHIGNLRAYVFVDVLRRTLEYLGYGVNHVMNITDVGHLSDDGDHGEDKLVRRSRESGRSVWDIAALYTDAFFEHTRRLNILPPHHAPRATGHIQDMIQLIERLEVKGYTYVSGGNVYYDISRFPRYGELAGLDLSTLKAGARVAVDANKRNPGDFVLWFTRSKFENQAMVWDSPWGRGYPGWHIECSAMSMKYLGEQLDIHCGGVDHIPVHHTNEIAQAEAATGKQYVKYWLHNEFLVMDKGKMSKSAGEFLTLDTLTEKGYDPLDYRYFCLLAHYRSELRFSFEALDAARAARRRIVSQVQKLMDAVAADADRDRIMNMEIPATSPVAVYLSDFRSDLEDDLNTPRALSRVWGLLKDRDVTPAEGCSAIVQMDAVLGLGLDTVQPATTSSVPDEVFRLVEERQSARERRDFARADEIRDEVLEMGYAIVDSADGPRVTRRDV